MKIIINLHFYILTSRKNYKSILSKSDYFTLVFFFSKYTLTFAYEGAVQDMNSIVRIATVHKTSSRAFFTWKEN